MNGGASILRLFCLLGLILLMATCKKNDQDGNRSPVFDADATIATQTYTQKIEITALMLPQVTSGNEMLSYSLIKSGRTALPNGLTFDGTMRVLSGRPATGTAVRVTDYELTATDEDGDEAKLTISITIRTASAMPIRLNAGTQRMTASSASNNATMMTSSVAWEATETISD